MLAPVGVPVDGTKQLVALELCGGESADAWQSFVDGLVARGLRAPLLCIIDGNPGLRRAVTRGWPRPAVQRCCVHKLRNLQAKAPAHARAEVTADFHRIVYAESGAAARAVYTRFERTWAKRCPGIVRSLQEGAELLTVFDFPREQWKTLRTTNVIERLNEEFRRRVKTQGSLPGEDAALLLLYSLVATGQITLRKLDGHEKITAVIRARVTPAGIRRQTLVTDEPEVGVCLSFGALCQRQHVMKMLAWDRASLGRSDGALQFPNEHRDLDLVQHCIACYVNEPQARGISPV